MYGMKAPSSAPSLESTTCHNTLSILRSSLSRCETDEKFLEGTKRMSRGFRKVEEVTRILKDEWICTEQESTGHGILDKKQYEQRHNF